MNATKVMKLEVITAPPELSLEAAHRLMLRRSVRHLPVLSGGKLAGIVSDRDILLAIGQTSDGSFVYPDKTVGEVMSLNPMSASPKASIANLAKTMVESKLDALPILKPSGELVGMVTSSDLMLLLTELPPSLEAELSFQIRRASELQAHA